MHAILLGTFNGARFLCPLLESLRQQSYRDWRLIVRDDGSTDGACEMLQEAADADDRVRLLPCDGQRLGSVGNFSRLLQAAYDEGAEVAFFADQDDVWLPDKVARQLETLAAAREQYGPHTPLLAHCDLAVVDEQLQTRQPSFMAFAGLRPETDDPLRTLLAQNFVTGCATAVNRPLMELAAPVPPAAPMHDWWLALCAAAAGAVCYVPKPLVLYRQHQDNQVGARRWWSKLNPLRTSWRQSWRRGCRNFNAGLRQAAALRSRLLERRDTLDSDRLQQSLETLDAYMELFTQSRYRLARPRNMRRQQIGAGLSPARRGLLYVRAVAAPTQAHVNNGLETPEKAVPAPADLAASVRVLPMPDSADGSAPTYDLDIGAIYTYEQNFMPPLLSTLAASGDGVRMRLLLVDNVSDDGAEQWRPLFPQVDIIRNQRRLGYAPNLNRILEASTAPYVLLLNTDMEFDPAEQCAARMVRFMDQNPDCGLSVCRIYHPDGHYAWPARRFQSLKTLASRRLGLSRLFGDEVDRYLYKHRDIYSEFDCDWVSGCFMMVRRRAYEQVGGFDCGFRKYFEDVDMCLRMSLAGWRVMFNGATSCIHCEQRASKRLLSRDGYLHARSYLRWLRKWGPAPGRRLKKAQSAQPTRRAA